MVRGKLSGMFLDSDSQWLRKAVLNPAVNVTQNIFALAFVEFV